MSIIDALKKSVLDQVVYSLNIKDLILSILIAFVIALFINYVYRKTFSGIVFNRSFSLTLILITLVTAMVIRTINSNLSLSLGMVGALSIVRFRTAIKEPTDTVFLFWGIAGGIMSGAGLYLAGIVASLLVGLLFYFVFTAGTKAKKQYLLVITYNVQVESQVHTYLNNIKKKELKSKATNQKGLVEETYEVNLTNTQVINEIQGIYGVNSVNLVSYKNEIGL